MRIFYKIKTENHIEWKKIKLIIIIENKIFFSVTIWNSDEESWLANRFRQKGKIIENYVT